MGGRRGISEISTPATGAEAKTNSVSSSTPRRSQDQIDTGYAGGACSMAHIQTLTRRRGRVVPACQKLGHGLNRRRLRICRRCTATTDR